MQMDREREGEFSVGGAGRGRKWKMPGIHFHLAAFWLAALASALVT